MYLIKTSVFLSFLLAVSMGTVKPYFTLLEKYCSSPFFRRLNKLWTEGILIKSSNPEVSLFLLMTFFLSDFCILPSKFLTKIFCFEELMLSRFFLGATFRCQSFQSISRCLKSSDESFVNPLICSFLVFTLNYVAY